MDSDLEVAKCFFWFGLVGRHTKIQSRKKGLGYRGKGIRGQYPDLFLLLLLIVFLIMLFIPPLRH